MVGGVLPEHQITRRPQGLRVVYEGSDMGIPVTAEGKRKMQAELEALNLRLPAIAKMIEEAREKGDLKENSEYHAAREEMSMTNARIGEVKSKLANAQVVDESQIDTSRIAFGAKIDLVDLKFKEVETWQLVGEGEDDPLENKILTSSPMGSALLGKKVGDTVVVKAPAGDIKFKVKAVSY
jgi:transcription elongation factor GreA